MARRLTKVCLVGTALMTLAAAAFAQDQSQNPFTKPGPADPVSSVMGLWRVDHADGSDPTTAALMGKMMRIDRNAVTSFTGGTCSNPSFTPGDGGKVAIGCVGQVLATAQLDTAQPDTLNWSEGSTQLVLHRVVTNADQPVDQNAGDQTGSGDQNSKDQGNSDQDNSDQGSDDSQ